MGIAQASPMSAALAANACFAAAFAARTRAFMHCTIRRPTTTRRSTYSGPPPPLPLLERHLLGLERRALRLEREPLGDQPLLGGDAGAVGGGVVLGQAERRNSGEPRRARRDRRERRDVDRRR